MGLRIVWRALLAPWRRAGLCAVLLSVGSVQSAQAEPNAAARAAEPNAAARATAESLFQQGVQLSRSGKHSAACPKFESSLKIERAIGTVLRLADCYDRLGRTASAWGLFEEALSLANTRGDKARAHIARRRSNHAKQRLSMLLIVVDEGIAELSPTITLNGNRLPEATWGSSLPVDPGEARLEVRASGYKSWSATVVVEEGTALTHIAVPRVLEAARQPNSKQPRERPDTLRALGFTSGGVGLVALISAARFGLSAQDGKEESLEHCRADDPNACTARGVELRDFARTRADAANIALGIGAVGLASAAALLIWGGDDRGPERVMVAPTLTRSHAGVRVQGGF